MLLDWALETNVSIGYLSAQLLLWYSCLTELQEERYNLVSNEYEPQSCLLTG